MELTNCSRAARSLPWASYLRLHTFKLTAHIEVFALGPHWGRGHRGLKHGAVVGLYGG